MALAYFSQLTGHNTIIAYSAYICKRMKTTLDPNISSIAILIMPILGNICNTHIADKWGRKTILNMSALGCFVALTSLSLFSYLNTNGYDLSSFEWIPVVCLALVVFIASSGFMPLSHIARVENLPTKVIDTSVRNHLVDYNTLKILKNYIYF